ncbi:leucyl aminopeptidase family protein [Hamadaea tsunoensis]|uniref:leucyl aminopeptidase family protein n=1 Tax=Hamadaea tsunoensis TaxID=53368 RepID=UPI0003F7B2CB|nr:leucyl aminopeptidase family protein [Hamadaea tsunoensis]
MLQIQLAPGSPDALAAADAVARPVGAGDGDAEFEAFVRQSGHTGEAGSVESYARPLQTPSTVIAAGVGAGDEEGWRAAGAGIVRSQSRAISITVDLTSAIDAAAAVRGFAEGAWLAGYAYGKTVEGPALTLLVADPAAVGTALEQARIVAERTCFARTLTNTPSNIKNPEWFVDQVTAAAGDAVEVEIWEPDRLAAEGFNGILAVGGGSDSGPRLLRLDYRPAGATRHVVLVGKGITFDTGGIDIKPADAMSLMRKDMGGAAAVVGALLAAADLHLPVRVTAFTPLAENMLSGRAWRPGDVVHHYGGLTSEVRSTDAEGRVVLGDALAYAVEQYEPDYLIDLATLTGASRVALGKRIAALFAENDELVKALTAAADEAGEQVWRLPMPSDYMSMITSEIADLYNAADGGAGTITAALFLREFAGRRRDRWAHIDMSAPAWSDEVEGPLGKGATGWGVRTLTRFLTNLA